MIPAKQNLKNNFISNMQPKKWKKQLQNFDESIHEQDDMDPKEFEKEHDGARESHKSRVNKFTRI